MRMDIICDASNIFRVPLVISLAPVATLVRYAASPTTQHHAAPHVTCTGLSGVGVVGTHDRVGLSPTRRRPAARANSWTGSRANSNDSIWTITWAGKHGTTIILDNKSELDKKGRCPKGWLVGWEGGKVTGGKGPAHTAIPNGQSMMVHFCAKPLSDTARIAKGTKLVL